MSRPKVYKFSKAEKKRFAVMVLHEIRDELMNAIPDMPPQWDGLEIRHYIAVLAKRKDYMMESKQFIERAAACDDTIAVGGM
jgi:hypothetical protein